MLLYLSTFEPSRAPRDEDSEGGRVSELASSKAVIGDVWGAFF